MKISDVDNEINDLIIEFSLMLKKLSKEDYESIIEPTKIKLKILMSLSEKFYKKIETKQDVLNDVLGSCRDMNMSKSNALFECAKYLVAYNELQNE